MSIRAYVDLEHLVVRFQRGFGRALDVNELMTKLQQWGPLPLTALVLYADARALPWWVRRQCLLHGLHVVDVPAKRPNGTVDGSAVDIVAILDASEAVLDPQVEEIILVTSNGHFAPLAARAKRLGKGVRVLAVRGALSSDLAAFADSVDFLEGRTLQRRSPGGEDIDSRRDQ